jgi:hypothetical protein
MSTARQVTCINKTDRYSRHERIRSLGGSWGKVSETEAIIQIENGSYTYHVRVDDRDVKVIVAVTSGKKYLKTEADTTTVDNLLSLPECPYLM